MLNWKIKYLIRKRHIGDVLWIEPVIREMAKRYKRVYVYTKYNELFNNYPYKNVIFKNKLNFFEKLILKVEKVIQTSLFFINLDMAYENSPQKHFLHAYQTIANVPATEEYPQLHLSAHEQTNAFVPNAKYVVLHLETMSDKNYRKVFGVNWELVVNHLKSLGFEVLLIGKNPVKITGAKVITTSLREMITVINNCSLFIGIDSGPSHIAASLKVPSLLFFGAVNPSSRHFLNILNGFILQQSCEFAGCYHTSISTSGPVCKLVGDLGVPKCSLHTSDYVINKIDVLLTQYNNNDKYNYKENQAKAWN